MDINNLDKNKFQIFRANDKYAKRRYDYNLQNYRDSFDRDRDKIIFSKEFRRLDGKTQVFLNGYEDHLRNRLAHTIEVSQVSQTISKFLGLNVMLTEAISLAHDVGHTPFGHVGERVLNYLTNNCNPYNNFIIKDSNELGFKHNWQGIKVVTYLENISTEHPGLNLTDYTLWGILNHTKVNYKQCLHRSSKLCIYNNLEKECKIDEANFSLSHYNKYYQNIYDNSWTFEAIIVSIADEIAQRHHDVEDGLNAYIIGKTEFANIFQDIYHEYLSDFDKSLINNIKNSNSLNIALHDVASLILNFYSTHLINNIYHNFIKLLEKNKYISSDDFHLRKNELNDSARTLIDFPDDFKKCDDKLKDYLYNRILNANITQCMDEKASHVLNNLIQAYISNPKLLPNGTIDSFTKHFCSENEYSDLTCSTKMPHAISKMRNNINNFYASNNDRFKTVLIRTITDFLAGMTDNFALNQYRMLYGTDNFWSIKNP